jgi:hypothetical protein
MYDILGFIDIAITDIEVRTMTILRPIYLCGMLVLIYDHNYVTNDEGSTPFFCGSVLDFDSHGEPIEDSISAGFSIVDYEDGMDVCPSATRFPSPSLKFCIRNIIAVFRAD